MSNPNNKGKRRAEPIGLRFQTFIDPVAASTRHCFVAASASDFERIKAKKVTVGDLVFVDFRKPRSPGFHRLAHAIGQLAVDNIPGFDHLTAHDALKRLQLEAGVGCEAIMVDASMVMSQTLGWVEENLSKAHADILRMSMCDHRGELKQIPVHVPRSLSYDSMDQEEFHMAMKGICRYISVRYWPGCSPTEIEDMVQAMSGDLSP